MVDWNHPDTVWPSNCIVGGYQINYLPNTDFIDGFLNDLYVASYSVSVLEKTPMNMTDNVFACCHLESGCSWHLTQYLTTNSSGQVRLIFSDVTDRGLAVLISWVFLADINMSCFPLKGQTCSGGTSPGVIRCFVFCKYPTTLSIMSIVLTIGSQRWITGTKRKLIYVQTLSQYKPKEIG